ncbi:hypothetical protein [Nonomuraea jiangxiensis]|uniref:hypothetical protein n=1 Tax=Nonomuraea jiangxiensis TaxID=633440 RepID=UPI0015A089DC|nr:hypothetical protein [Nonomuraea jiangxiensis]
MLGEGGREGGLAQCRSDPGGDPVDIAALRRRQRSLYGGARPGGGAQQPCREAVTAGQVMGPGQPFQRQGDGTRVSKTRSRSGRV